MNWTIDMRSQKVQTSVGWGGGISALIPVSGAFTDGEPTQRQRGEELLATLLPPAWAAAGAPGESQLAALAELDKEHAHAVSEERRLQRELVDAETNITRHANQAAAQAPYRVEAARLAAELLDVQQRLADATERKTEAAELYQRREGARETAARAVDLELRQRWADLHQRIAAACGPLLDELLAVGAAATLLSPAADNLAA